MDWISFLEDRKIYYRTHGANVSQGQVVTHCPWCGLDDHSEHLSISLSGKGFRCWRNPKHSGKNPAKLIHALLGVSWAEAMEIAGQGKSLPSSFLGHLKGIMEKTEEVPKQKLVMPREFKEFKILPSAKPYIEYIHSRGFMIQDAHDYDVRYASIGDYKGRIVFPVYFNQELVGWTGRTIFKAEPVRYRTLTNDVEKAKQQGVIPAPYPITDYLLFFDVVAASDAHTIVLCEGPFDAWRVNVLGSSIGVVATCFFTSTASKKQLELLYNLLPKFETKLLLLDQNTFSKAERLKAELSSFDVKIRNLPDGIKDPGEIRNTHMLKSCLQSSGVPYRTDSAQTGALRK